MDKQKVPVKAKRAELGGSLSPLRCGIRGPEVLRVEVILPVIVLTVYFFSN